MSFSILLSVTQADDVSVNRMYRSITIFRLALVWKTAKFSPRGRLPPGRINLYPRLLPRFCARRILLPSPYPIEADFLKDQYLRTLRVHMVYGKTINI